MSHEIETMFYQHETPWHGLGRYVDHAPTAAEAIQAAGLGWSVEMQPVYVRNADGTYSEVPDTSAARKAVRRDTDGKVLAVLGDQYTPLQNADAFNFFDPWVQAGHFEYESAGSLKGGRRVWVLASMADGVREVVHGDAIKAHLLLTNTHDGSGVVASLFTNVRVVCWNTLTAALGEGTTVAKARHTRGVQLKVEQMREGVAALHEQFAAALEKYRFLASAPMNTRTLELYVKALFGHEADAEGLPKGGAPIINLFESGKGQQLPGVRGTMWAALNAVTEYVDHHRNGNGDAVDRRLESAWFGQGAELKRKALELAIKGAMAIKAA
jgi:phage/plasmid-like protein (TIGR03299 family)